MNVFINNLKKCKKMKELFFRTLRKRVSKRINKPVSKEQIEDAIVKILAFGVVAFAALLYIACFVYVVIIENHFGV